MEAVICYEMLENLQKILSEQEMKFGLEVREYCRGDLSRLPRNSLYAQKLALTSSTSDCRSVGIVRSRTKAMEFSFHQEIK
jgi:hypothetical protein